jgi:pimeloyl-ACP methyl ester carboxylesterase
MIRFAAGVLAALLVVLSAAGCTGSSSSRASSATPSSGSTASASGRAAASGSAASGQPPATRSARPTTLAGYYAQALAWTPCDKGFECARLYVPFDYAHPAGPAFTLPVIKLPAATPAKRIGALVINPGGPGASGVEYALGAQSGEFTQDVLDRFDIVGFDPRGVGGSVPALRCLTGPQADKYLAVNEAPAGAAQLSAVINANKGFAQACARNARALLPYVGTAASARDMDVLRAALGESRLNYLGKSYGTVLGASYAQQFPSRVRALVLDGAVAPGVSGTAQDITQAQGFSVAFTQFVTWCAAQASCPLPAAPSAAVARVSALIAAANARPLGNQVNTTQSADGAMLLLGIAAALYTKSAWPFLRDGLLDAFTYQDGSVLVQLADNLEERSPNGTYSNLIDVGAAVDCVDWPWPRSLPAWQSAAAAAAKASPMFGPSLLWNSLSCAYWPVPAAPVLGGASPSSSSSPVLVVGDLHDPATPYSWAIAMARWLRPGVLLGWNGEGHTSYMEGSSCIDAAVDAYLINLTVPHNGTICP